MTRASGTTRGSAVSRPGTSFHSDTSRAPSARPSSVAVRSEPPRPSVATARSSVDAAAVVLDARAADEPGDDRDLARRDQRLQPLARRQVGQRQVRRRAAERSVGEHHLGRVDVAGGVPAARSAAAKMCADSRSPRLTTKSRVRAVSSLSAARLCSSAASSSKERSISAAASSPAPFAPRAVSASGFAVAFAQRRRPRRHPLPSPARRASLAPAAVGDARGRRHHHRLRSRPPLTIVTACRNAAPSDSDAPPNL